MKTLAGKITISRTRVNVNDDAPLRIEVVDEDSRVRAIEIRMSLSNFAEAVLGMGYVDCVFEFNDTGNVGKLREHKTELVPWKDHEYANRDKAARKAVSEFEVDGWTGYDRDYLNHHNRTGNKVRVTFERWVEKPNART
jgi:hypothetical protein